MEREKHRSDVSRGLDREIRERSVDKYECLTDKGYICTCIEYRIHTAESRGILENTMTPLMDGL